MTVKNITTQSAATIARKSITLDDDANILSAMGNTPVDARLSAYMGGFRARVSAAVAALNSPTGMSVGPDGRVRTATEHYTIAATNCAGARKLLQMFSDKPHVQTTWVKYNVKDGDGWIRAKSAHGVNDIPWQDVAKHNAAVFAAHSRPLMFNGEVSKFLGKGWQIEVPKQTTVRMNLAPQALQLNTLVRDFSRHLLDSVPSSEAASLRSLMQQMGV